MNRKRIDPLPRSPLLDRLSRRDAITGSAALVMAAVLEIHDAIASKKKKRKKRKRRCHKLTEDCGKGKRRLCCSGLACDAVAGGGTGKQCCRRIRKPCRDANDCCGDMQCDGIDSICCRGLNQSCTSGADCCSLLSCLDSTCRLITFP